MAATSDISGHKAVPVIVRTDADSGSSINETTRLINNEDDIVKQNNDAEADDEKEYPTGLRLKLIIFALVTIEALTSIDMNIVATAVPSITNEFHTVADVGLYASAFRLCLCSFQFLFGKGFTLFSTKRLSMFANGILLVGSIMCAIATSSTMFVFGRAITGIATAGIGAAGINIIVQSVPLARRPIYQSMLSSLEGVSVLCGPLLGGIITQYLGWRWCFYINLPVGSITMLITWLCIPDVPTESDRSGVPFMKKLAQLDWLSNFMFIPAMACLFLAMTWGGIDYAWSSSTIIGLFVAAAVLLVGFIVDQVRQGDKATLPARIIGRRSVLAAVIFFFCSNSACQLLDYFLPIYYQAAHGFAPAVSGYLMLPLIICATVAVMVQGAGTTITGQYGPFMLLSTVIMVLSTWMITTFSVDTGVIMIILCTGLAGFGYGVGISAPFIAVQTMLAESDMPLAISLCLFANSFGPTVSFASAQVLFLNLLADNLHDIVPGLTLKDIQGSGLSELAERFPEKASDIIAGISWSVTHTWYLAVALACAMIIGTVTIEWRSIKTEDKPAENGEGEA